MATEITIKPKQQIVLRDYAHMVLRGIGDIELLIQERKFAEAQERSREARVAMDGLDIIGWGDEQPHPITLCPGYREAEGVRKLAEACRAEAKQEIAEAHLDLAEVAVEQCDKVLGDLLEEVA